MRDGGRTTPASLLRHILLYALARGGSAALNFIAIAVYTRLLSPDEYGHYALVVAGVGLCNMVFYQWLRSSILRFLPAHEDNPGPLLGATTMGFVLSSAVAGALAIAIALIWSDSSWQGHVLLGLFLLLALGWFEVTLDLLRSQMQPTRYGVLSWTKAAIALAAGVPLVMGGLGSSGPLVGLLLGALVAGVLLGWREWRGISPQRNWQILGRLFAYGAPLAAASILGFVVSSSDRFMIAALISEGAVGAYAATYDLAQQSLGFLLMVSSLATYPVVVRALENHGLEAAKTRLNQNATLLLGLGVPGALGLAVLAPNIASVFLGAGFREHGAAIVPWVAAAAVLGGLKTYHFDLAFHLGGNTQKLVWISALTAMINVVLNLMWIPTLGILGAAYATVAAVAVGVLASAWLGRRVFAIPFPGAQAGRILLAGGVMTMVLWPLRSYEGILALIFQVLMGVGVYGVAAFILNVGNVRGRIVACIRR